MPISFLEQTSQLDARLKARQLVREFASHRFGVFKESGFRNDPMYPPFVSLPGFGLAPAEAKRRPLTGGNRTLVLAQPQPSALILDNAEQFAANQSAARRGAGAAVRGFDEHWNPCAFETTPANGLPVGQAATCLPYLARTAESGQQQQHSFNLMSTDPFSLLDLAAINRPPIASGTQPLEWRDLADSARWHFCGDNFPVTSPLEPAGSGSAGPQPAELAPRLQRQSFAHNQLAANKQNVMCQERSAMEIIKASDDFHRTPFR